MGRENHKTFQVFFAWIFFSWVGRERTLCCLPSRMIMSPGEQSVTAKIPLGAKCLDSVLFQRLFTYGDSKVKV